MTAAPPASACRDLVAFDSALAGSPRFRFISRFIYIPRPARASGSMQVRETASAISLLATRRMEGVLDRSWRCMEALGRFVGRVSCCPAASRPYAFPWGNPLHDSEGYRTFGGDNSMR